MKFAKVLLIAAVLSPSVAAAQPAQPPAPLSLVPTNFVFLAPIITSFIAVPIILGEDDDFVPAVIPPVAPTPTPVVTTR